MARSKARKMADGEMKLTRDGASKLEANATGVDVTGTVTADGVSLGDNQKAQFGAGNDLQIHSDGSNSIIKESGSGNLIINGDQVNIANAADTEYKARFNTNGSVQLYYDNAEKLATTSEGIDIGGKAEIAIESTDNVRMGATTNNGAGLLFWSEGSKPTINPLKEGASADAQVDFGRETERFRKLWLSEEVVVKDASGLKTNYQAKGAFVGGYHKTHSMGGINQGTNMAQTAFSGWSAPYNTITANHTNLTQSGTTYNSKSAAAKEFLTACDRQTRYFRRNVYSQRVSLGNGREGSHAFPYLQFQYPYEGIVTIAAWVKRISGNMPRNWYLAGYDTSAGGWQLCGVHLYGSATDYSHCHPYGNNAGSACVVDIALPGVVYGYVNLDNPRNWWVFRNKSGAEN